MNVYGTKTPVGVQRLLGRPDPVSAHWGRLLRRGVQRGMGRPSSGATSRPLTLALLPELPTLLGFPAAPRLSGPHVFRSIPGSAGGSAKGRVSRAHRLSTTVRNCTRDEGGPFEVGSQVQVSSHRKLLSSRAMVVSVAETSGPDPGRRGERKRTADDVSKAD